MITPKEKAEQLISNFSPYVYCYMGSGMLTNTCDDEVIKMNAKQCALIAIEEIMQIIKEASTLDVIYYNKEYWVLVKQEIEKL